MNDVFAVKSLCKRCEKTYNDRYFPNSKVMSCKEFSQEYSLTTVPYSQLENTEQWGMLFAVNRNDDGVLEITFQDSAHCLVVGTTQVGKTWGHVMNSVNALSAKKNKPSFMITDPKGEIFENTAASLLKRGYRIFALNFKNTQYTNMWNPLLEIYDSWIEMNTVDNDVEYHKSLKNLSKYTLTQNITAFEKTGDFWSFDGKAYADTETLDYAIARKRGDIESRTTDLVNQLVSSLGAGAVQTSKDPGWQLGALEIIRGMIYLMLEDAIDERSGFERKNMNFMNMQRYYEKVRESVLTGTMNTPLLRTTKLMHKKITDESIRHMRAYFENAPTTARSYLGVFENIMQDWFNPKIYAIANDNNIDIGGNDETPFAVFLITRDYEKSDYFIAGLFVDWVYKQMLSKAERIGGKLNKEMFFILDEFANIPVINGFTSKISTSLSRRIIFQLYVQSYEQIEGNYGNADSGAIRANCNVEIFLGSQSYRTKRDFSDNCSKMRIKTLDAALSPDKNTVMEIPVLSINRLEDLKQGEAYVKRLNRPVSKTNFEMAFKCPELLQEKTSVSDIGICSKPYNDEVFVYKYLENDCTMIEFGRTQRTQSQKNGYSEAF